MLNNKYVIYLRYEKTASKTLIREIFLKKYIFASIDIKNNSHSKADILKEKLNQFEKKYRNKIIIVHLQLQINLIKENKLNNQKDYFYNLLNTINNNQEYNFKLILGIRDQINIFESYFTQIIKNGYYVNRYDLLKSHFFVWKYSYIVKELIKIIKQDKIFFFIFNEFQNDKELVLNKLCSFIEGKNITINRIGTSIFNPRRDESLVFLYKIFNKLRLRGKNKLFKIPKIDVFIAYLSKFINILKLNKTNKINYPNKDLFIEIYSNDNIELEKLIDVNLKQYNFPIK